LTSGFAARWKTISDSFEGRLDGGRVEKVSFDEGEVLIGNVLFEKLHPAGAEVVQYGDVV
jgi:hypothetical protein